MATGRLEAWEVMQFSHEEYIIWGSVYEDEEGRFKDGEYIHTSTVSIKDFPSPKEGDVVTTRNSTYLLGCSVEDATRLTVHKMPDVGEVDEEEEQ